MSIHRQQAVIKREFAGLPVVDADSDIRVHLDQGDIDGATKKDFENCVIANACKRAFGSKVVAILKRYAYVDVAEENGNRRVERFVVSPKARELIVRFDKGGKIKSGACFVLRAPRESARLDSQYKRYKKSMAERQRRARKARLKGEISDPTGRNKETEPFVRDLVRNGTGMIQMLNKKKSK